MSLPLAYFLPEFYHSVLHLTTVSVPLARLKRFLSFPGEFMVVIGYLCHSTYGCNCESSNLLSRKTALLHRSNAGKKAEEPGETRFFSLPRAIRSYDELLDMEYETDETASRTERSESGSEITEGTVPLNSNASLPENREDICEISSEYVCSSQPQELLSIQSLEESVVSPGDTESFESSSESELHAKIDDDLRIDFACNMFRDPRFNAFMEHHADLVGLSIKHWATEVLLYDLLKSATKKDHPVPYFKTFKGVKKALLRNSGLVTTLHPARPMFHRALKVQHDKTLQQCVDCDGTVTSRTSFEYICVWERIKAQLESKARGPQLRDYYQSMLVEACSEERCEYSDFHSGSLFKEVVNQLGGMDNVMDDIFLSLSADGVQPFKSDDYSCWPVVATVLNLTPFERYKSKKLLPLLIIPGPNSPKNLTSFIQPFLDELEPLSRDGRMVPLCNGECFRVRVHLLFVLADLPAMKKLTHLKGHNGLVPCRLCVI